MEHDVPTAADAAAVAELVVAVEAFFYGASTFSLGDLEEEWAELDLQRDVRVVRDGERIAGYRAVRDRGERWRVEGYVHPEAHGRGIGTQLATALEEEAARGGARRIQNSVFEPDQAARALLAG